MKDEKTKKVQPLESSLTILDMVQHLWNRRWIILLFTLLTVIFGYAYAMWVRPQFTSDVLLQVNVKGSSSKSTKALGEMGAVLDLASPADAEIELIKSRMVLSEVVAAEHLHIWTVPIGVSDRFAHTEGRMDVDS